jgi:hypothetical protein
MLTTQARVLLLTKQKQQRQAGRSALTAETQNTTALFVMDIVVGMFIYHRNIPVR